MTKYLLILFVAGACNGAIMSSYGGRYRDSAHARTVRIENYRREHDTSNKDFRFCKLSVRKYHPDSLCCAVGWRCLKGCILWIQHGMMRVRVKASDVMAPGYNDTLELHVDVSWRVYRALGVKHRCEVIVTVDSQSLIKHKAMNIEKGKVYRGILNPPIVWMISKKGNKMPIDAGTVPPEEQRAEPATVQYVHTRHISHHATCPFAAEYRRPR